MSGYLHEDLTKKIIKAFYIVYNKLGYGFAEKIYENSMLIELRKMGISCQKQVPIKVFYEGQEVGNYFADILVEDKVIIELKAVSIIIEEHKAQLLNYLKATKIEIGLILNFGNEPQISRKIFENRLK